MTSDRKPEATRQSAGFVTKGLLFMTTAALTVVLTVTLVPHRPAQAFNPCCPANIAAINAANTAITNAIAASTTTLVGALQTHGQSIINAIQGQTAAQKEMVQSLLVEMGAIEVRKTAYEAETHVRDLYGTPGEIICQDAITSNLGRRQASGQAGQPRSRSRNQVMQNITEWQNTDLPMAGRIVSGAEMEAEAMDVVGAMMGFPATDHALTMTAEERQEVVQRMVEWAPVVLPTEREAGGPQGIVLQSAINERRLRLAPAQNILAHAEIASRPRYNLGDEMRRAFDEANPGNGDPEGRAALNERLSANSDLISYQELLELEVMKRGVHNASYVRRIQSGDITEADLLRETVMQLALANTLAFEHQTYERSLAVLMASAEAREVDRDTRARINNLRRQAAGVNVESE